MHYTLSMLRRDAPSRRKAGCGAASGWIAGACRERRKLKHRTEEDTYIVPRPMLSRPSSSTITSRSSAQPLATASSRRGGAASFLPSPTGAPGQSPPDGAHCGGASLGVRLAPIRPCGTPSFATSNYCAAAASRRSARSPTPHAAELLEQVGSESGKYAAWPLRPEVNARSGLPRLLLS